jgi:cyclophilin family peptidyl-prolyl cis-trans isomerase/HEAT repeat protein
MPLRKLIVSASVLVVVSTTAGAQPSSGRPDPAAISLYARILAMTDTRQLDTALVDRSLASGWRPLRGAATIAIGQVGREKGLPGAPRLRRLLHDPDSSVAANAAYALGLLRDSSSISDLTAVLDAPAAVAREAAWALGEIGGPSRGAITAALRNQHRGDVAVQLLLAAAKLRPVPLAAIRPYLRNANPAEVWVASYALARTRASGGVRDLLALADAPVASSRVTTSSAEPSGNRGPYTDQRLAPARIRAEIARGLARTAAGDSLGAQAFATLSRLAHDADPHVRINALRSLGTYRGQATAVLVSATKDADANVRVAAAQSLSSSFPSDDNAFAGLWDADTSVVYRSSLLASASSAGLRPPQLRDWATSPDWHLRAAVANAAGDSLDRAFAIFRARPLLLDADPRVRESAYGALAPPASMSLEDSVHDLLISGLRDPDFYVRATVLGVLADHPTVADLPAVLASYRLAAKDSANDARLASLQYVAAVWKRDSTSLTSGLRSELSAMPVPSDPLERNAGSGISPWSRWSSVVPPPRPPAWYDSVVRQMVLPIVNGKRITATLSTVRGPVTLELFGADAPVTVWNFLSLARSGYYRNTRFHRVVPNFVAQDGDPRDDGNGGPGYAIRDEMNRHRYERGAVGMALSGPDTGGSQYFITHSPQPHLDGHYTVFGRVLRGYTVLDRIVQGDLIVRIDPR